MHLPRPCITCGRRTRPGRTRCAPCERIVRREWDAPSANRRRQRLATGDGAAARLRRSINRGGGAVCAKCFAETPAPLCRVDHAVRLVDGGLDVDENCQTLCAPCHQRKTTAEQSTP